MNRRPKSIGFLKNHLAITAGKARFPNGLSRLIVPWTAQVSHGRQRMGRAYFVYITRKDGIPLFYQLFDTSDETQLLEVIVLDDDR
jgi:hypothetical protein